MNAQEMKREINILKEVNKAHQENMESLMNRVAITELDCAWLRKNFHSMKGRLNTCDSSR